MKKNISVFIFARGGSKSIKNKNLKKICNISLVEHSILLAKQIKNINKIYLSSDSNKILSIGKKNSIELIKRPKYLATDNSDEIKAWKHAIAYAENKNDNFNVFLSLPPTAPLRKIVDIKKCIRLINKQTDIVLTAYKSNNNPWFNMVSIDKSLNAKLISKVNKFKANRQNYKRIYNVTTACYVAKKSYLQKCNNIFDGKVKAQIIPKERSIDIDDNIDIEIARLLYKKII